MEKTEYVYDWGALFSPIAIFTVRTTILIVGLLLALDIAFLIHDLFIVVSLAFGIIALFFGFIGIAVEFMLLAAAFILPLFIIFYIAKASWILGIWIVTNIPPPQKWLNGKFGYILLWACIALFAIFFLLIPEYFAEPDQVNMLGYLQIGALGSALLTRYWRLSLGCAACFLFACFVAKPLAQSSSGSPQYSTSSNPPIASTQRHTPQFSLASISASVISIPKLRSYSNFNEDVFLRRPGGKKGWRGVKRGRLFGGKGGINSLLFAAAKSVVVPPARAIRFVARSGGRVALRAKTAQIETKRAMKRPRKLPWGDLAHIFRNAKGHFKVDNKKNRAILQKTARKGKEWGTTIYGNTVYARAMPDGRQSWVHVRKGILRNGGFNDPPRTKFDPNSGSGLVED